MSSKLIITVKKESLSSSMSIGFGGKDKPYILASIDGNEPVNLVLSNDPYVFELAPGQHEVRFEDGNPKLNVLGGAMKAATAIAVGGFMMGATGFFSGAVDAAMDMGSLMGGFGGKKSVIKEGYAGFSLKDGETIKLSCQKAGSNKIKPESANFDNKIFKK